MFHLLKRTVQPFKILFNNSNNTDFIKFSTINVGSSMSQSRFPISNQMIANYSKGFHNGLTLQVQDKPKEFVIQRKNVSKSAAFVKLSVILSKVGKAVETKYFYARSKPDMTLFKNRGIIILNEDSKTPPGEFLACDLISVIVAAVLFSLLLSSVSGPRDPKAIKEEAIVKMDKKVKKLKIKLEYWSALEEAFKEWVALGNIVEILMTDDMVLKALQEVYEKPKEELSPKLVQIQEIAAEMPQDPKIFEEAIGVMTKYGNIWDLTEDQKILTTLNLRWAHPMIKKARKGFEEIYALTRTLSMEDFSKNNNETETKVPNFFKNNFFYKTFITNVS